MKIAFRTDASNRMGLGHLTRCRTLGKSLRAHGAAVHFICRQHPGNQIQALQNEGYSVSALPKAPEQTTTDGDYAAWLGVSQDQDAEETRAALQTNANDGKYDPVDWLIVDHYGLDERWEQQLRPMAHSILVIDDLANRPHDCDLLLDQNYSADMENRYDDKLPQNAEHLIGPEYALLRPEYAEWRKSRQKKTDQVRRVFVFFGGTDPNNLTGMTLSALSSPAFERMAVDVVVGANNPNKEAIEAQASAAPNITLHSLRPDLADLMAKADLAIGAGGTTTWERCCLGLPSLVISIAENQRSACDAMAGANIIEYLGHKDCITEQSLLAAIEKLVSETALRNTLAEASAALVDGRGIQRVMSAIAQLMPLKPLTVDDLELILPWRNAPAVRRAMYSHHEISLSEHQAWFAKVQEDPSREWYLYHDTDGEPQGVVYFTDIDRQQKTAFWGFYAKPGAPMGMGLRMELEAVDLAFSDFKFHKLNCEVLADNPKVVNLHKKVGFTEEGHFREQHQNDSERVDVIRLGLLATEWPEHREQLQERILQLSDIKHNSTPPHCEILMLSDASSWINSDLVDLQMGWEAQGHRVAWAHDADAGLTVLAETKANTETDYKLKLCFCLSFSEILDQQFRSHFDHVVIVHESDLPKGKGWSPLTWQVLKGQNRIPVTLLEAADKVDSGVVYGQRWIEFEGDELIDELRAGQAEATHHLCRWFVDHYPVSAEGGTPQQGEESFYARRCPKDSQLDPRKNLAEQFDLLRVVDNQRYPAFFEYAGARYNIFISKWDRG